LGQVLKLAASLLVLALFAGCAVVFDGSAPPATLKPAYTLAPPTPLFSPARTPPTVPATHGTPYTGADLRTLILASSGIPKSLTAPDIADAIAPHIWTYDGLPYQEVRIAASCDDDGIRCELTVEGIPGFAINRDNADGYLFTIHTNTGVIEDQPPQSTKGFPAEVVPELDGAVRAISADRIGQRSLRWVTWLAQPPGDAYLLHYAVDDSVMPDVDIVYDRVTGNVSIQP
jgi:hypothetical protein